MSRKGGGGTFKGPETRRKGLREKTGVADPRRIKQEKREIKTTLPTIKNERKGKKLKLQMNTKKDPKGPHPHDWGVREQERYEDSSKGMWECKARDNNPREEVVSIHWKQ